MKLLRMGLVCLLLAAALSGCGQSLGQVVGVHSIGTDILSTDRVQVIEDSIYYFDGDKVFVDSGDGDPIQIYQGIQGLIGFSKEIDGLYILREESAGADPQKGLVAEFIIDNTVPALAYKNDTTGTALGVLYDNILRGGSIDANGEFVSNSAVYLFTEAGAPTFGEIVAPASYYKYPIMIALNSRGLQYTVVNFETNTSRTLSAQGINDYYPTASYFYENALYILLSGSTAAPSDDTALSAGIAIRNHLGDYLIAIDLTTYNSSVVFNTRFGERIIGMSGNYIYIYKNNAIYIYQYFAAANMVEVALLQAVDYSLYGALDFYAIENYIYVYGNSLLIEKIEML